MNHTAVCWINQTIKPAREASISVFDHGLLYGDGIFEGLRFYRGKTFMLEATCSACNPRLTRSDWKCPIAWNR